MAWQGLKLNLKVAQKQILTPGLVQMVSVLALNRLELREMINQEMIANPVLEELSEEPTQSDNYSDETFLKAETEKVPEKPEPNPFDEFDVGTFFNQYLDSGGDGGKSQEREVSERPSFEKFLSSPSGLTDHLAWQLSVTICSDAVKELAESILFPSRSIREGYQRVEVETKNEETLEGLVKTETNDELTLRDANGNNRRVSKADIKDRHNSQLSLMPEGLEAGMALQDFADLVAYLSSLKGNGQ